MASLIVTRGLQVIGGRASNTADAFNAIQVMSVDDSGTGFVAGDTQLNNPTNEFNLAFDSTPTRAGQVVTHVMTVPTGSGNFTIKRVALHNDVNANVGKTSLTLVAGIDSQSLTKTSAFSLTITVTITYTAV